MRTIFGITSSNIQSVFTRGGGRRSKLSRDVSVEQGRRREDGRRDLVRGELRRLEGEA
ncbi:hypothetical protein E2C01_101500 [Portunus trituberculatus]|uniref:Uncharacterized protein n=1 Tax=Portunus trituberculatus TaxID=210409 RepID=A0A5B7KEX5_PORTR|nr:hypothetical protein [Portunus trituberculatus]